MQKETFSNLKRFLRHGPSCLEYMVPSKTGKCICGLNEALEKFEKTLSEQKVNPPSILTEALTPFIKEAKSVMPEGADPSLWVQLYINMAWLRNAYLALHPEKEEETKKMEDFYSFMSTLLPPGEIL